MAKRKFELDVLLDGIIVEIADSLIFETWWPSYNDGHGNPSWRRRALRKKIRTVYRGSKIALTGVVAARLTTPLLDKCPDLTDVVAGLITKGLATKEGEEE